MRSENVKHRKTSTDRHREEILQVVQRVEQLKIRLHDRDRTLKISNTAENEYFTKCLCYRLAVNISVDKAESESTKVWPACLPTPRNIRDGAGPGPDGRLLVGWVGLPEDE